MTRREARLDAAIRFYAINGIQTGSTALTSMLRIYDELDTLSIRKFFGCLSAMTLSPINGNVKMSPHEICDIFTLSEKERQRVSASRPPIAIRRPALYGRPAGPANFSAQRIRPVICMATNRVTIAPMVIARPVKPSKKKA
jgi:hypothetical protein